MTIFKGFRLQKKYIAFFTIVPLLISTALIQVECPVLTDGKPLFNRQHLVQSASCVADHSAVQLNLIFHLIQGVIDALDRCFFHIRAHQTARHQVKFLIRISLPQSI